MKIISSILMLIPLMALLAGCNREPESAQETYENASRQQVQALQNRASALAKGELERLAATEMIYRNQTYHFEHFNPILGKMNGAFGKLYRQFTDFEVLDIVNSPSVLRPVTVIVRFNYDLIGTRPELGERNRAKLSKIAQNNNNYLLLKRDTLSLEYDCDKAGNPLEQQLKILSRLNFWKDVEGLELGEFTTRAIQTQH